MRVGESTLLCKAQGWLGGGEGSSPQRRVWVPGRKWLPGGAEVAPSLIGSKASVVIGAF